MANVRTEADGYVEAAHIAAERLIAILRGLDVTAPLVAVHLRMQLARELVTTVRGPAREGALS